MDKIDRYCCTYDGMEYDFYGDYVRLEDHERIVTEMQKRIEHLEDSLFDTQCQMSEMVEP